MLKTDEVKNRLDKIVAMFVEDVGTIRTGRATPGLIENVRVSVYDGQEMSLKELGSIGVADVRNLTFKPWDASLLKEIKNGIARANLGMNPVVEGDLIRMALPMLTTEQREDYVRLLGRKLEGARNMVRGCRSDYRKKLMDAKQAKELSEDDFKRDETELQKMIDEYIIKLKDVADKKEKEIRG
ncbi:ribosome recycling factor [Candidatus Shapirobacteria bacterium]|nr:MAG: ribosome recycling factor [Candidatus Shapirobacteria bacterium]